MSQGDFKEQITAWCERHFEEQLALLKTLAAIPAPSHHEERRAEFILHWLRAAGAENAYIDPALNVVLPFACEGRDDFTVYMAHTDVVFPDTDALPVREEDGRLWGPGVGDDTANVAALMLCAEFLLTEKPCQKKPILIVFNSCEEGLGNLKGVRRIMEDFTGRVKELVSFDGEYTSIVNRAVGSERWRVLASTVGGHSYGAFGNPNAITHLAKLIVKLDGQSVPMKPDCKTTFNVGTIQGGTSVNTIAQSAQMTYEYRSDDKESIEIMRDQFKALLREADCDDAHFEAELLGERPCGDSVPKAAEEALLWRCAGIVEEFTGEKPSLRSGSTDANIPLSMGIPAATFGLYLGDGAHTREEYIEIDSLLTGLKIGLAVVVSSLCGE